MTQNIRFYSCFLGLFLSMSMAMPSFMGMSSHAEELLPLDSKLDASGEPEEGNESTLLNELAPDESPSTRGKVYDQGVTIANIKVEGNHLIPEDKIKQAMALRPGSLYSRRTLQQDLRRVYDLGYFTDKVKAVPTATRQGIVLRVQVEENVPVTGVNIEGNTIIKDEELQTVFADQTGLPQNIGQLNEAIEKIEKLYADKGFILARVTSIADDPDGLINLEVNEGVIDRVQFIGNRKTKDGVIKRNMGLKPGDVYNEKILSQDLKRLFGTQSFSDVRRVITASPDNPDMYNLTVEVDEKRTGAISLGGGVDTTTGLFGSVGYSDPNFLGRGQNLSSFVSVGSGVINRGQFQANSRNYQFDLNWSTPSVFDSPNALGAGLYGRDLSSFNVPLAIERRIGTEVTWSRPILSMPNTSFSLGLRGERVALRDAASPETLQNFNITDSIRKKQLEGGTFVSLSPTLAYDTRNNRFDPSSGWFNTVSTTGALGVGASSYGSLTANVRKYIKVRDGVTLAFNTQAGSSVLGDMPEFNMYRLGGAYSVRGFQEGGLGTGSGFLLGSAELRSKVPFLDKVKNVPMLDSLRTALFVDAGTLFGESETNSLFRRSGTGVSIGAGLRFNIPGLGPIRVDYAFPVYTAGGNNSYVNRFNFGIGQKF
jgi:outer membrane protein insertion porin family